MTKILDNKIFKVIIITIFIVYIFSLCFAMSITTEYNSAPDEEMKYDVCKYIANNLKLPHGGDESIRNPIWGISYAFTPILSYMFSAAFMRMAMLLTQSEFAILIAARFVSVLCIVFYAIMCIKISNKLFKGIYKFIFVVFVTLLPQLLYLGSYINNDSLALLSISIIVYSWILGLENNWNWKSCIIMGIGIGICSLSYYNAYGYILCSIIIYFLSSYIKKIKIKDFLKKGVVIALITFAIAGWWFIRSYILYDGDFLGLTISSQYSEKYAIDEFKPSNRQTPHNQNMSLKYMLFDLDWIKTTEKSFIGRFGYMNVVMSRWLYLFYEINIFVGIICIALTGILKIIKTILNRKKHEKPKICNNKKYEKVLFNIIMIICIIIPIILSIYYSYFSDFQAQGRYIMPMIIPFMYFIVVGIQKVFDKLIKNIKIKNLFLGIIGLIWVVLPIYIYLKYILPI